MTTEELISKAKCGDIDAFELLIDDIRLNVINIAYGLLNNYDDALDISQDVFINVFRGLASFKGQSAFSTWVYRITKNRCIDVMRKKRIVAVPLSYVNEDGEEEAIELPADGKYEPENVYAGNTTRRAVFDAMTALPEKMKEAIVLVCMNGLTYEEAAEILHVPVGTVKSRVNAARNRLRDSLKTTDEPSGNNYV